MLQAYKNNLENGKNEAEKGLPEVQVSNECPIKIKSIKKDKTIPASKSTIKTVDEQLADTNSEPKINDIENLYALMSNMNFFNSDQTHLSDYISMHLLDVRTTVNLEKT